MSPRLLAPVAALAAWAGFGQPAAAAEAPAQCTPAAVGADSFCTVGGVRLHYVDWGGSGPVIILLSGLGDSARIFDDLAPRLAKGHRVLALTRRGYGQSDHGQTDYSNEALVGDVLGVMDALSIARASFVGHSVAGGELSAIGARHGQRVDRLVYLDSAYDRTRALELTNNVPRTPPPAPGDLASVEAAAHWREELLGVRSKAIVENVAETVRVADGKVEPVTPISVMLAVLAGDVRAKPRYEEISAPALAIYSSKDVAEQISPASSPQQRTAVVDYSTHNIRPWMLRAQADFLEKKTCGVAITLPRSTHYFFLVRSDWTADAILAFLGSKDPCHWVPASLPSGG